MERVRRWASHDASVTGAPSPQAILRTKKIDCANYNLDSRYVLGEIVFVVPLPARTMNHSVAILAQVLDQDVPLLIAPQWGCGVPLRSDT